MRCSKNGGTHRASSSWKAFMPLIRDILTAGVLPLKAQLESSRREGKMVKPEGALGSVLPAVLMVLLRGTFMQGVWCVPGEEGWRSLLQMLFLQWNVKGIAQALQWLRADFGTAFICSPSYHKMKALQSSRVWMTFTTQGQAGFFAWASKAFLAANCMCRNRNFPGM